MLNTTNMDVCMLYIYKDFINSLYYSNFNKCLHFGDYKILRYLVGFSQFCFFSCNSQKKTAHRLKSFILIILIYFDRPNFLLPIKYSIIVNFNSEMLPIVCWYRLLKY